MWLGSGAELDHDEEMGFSMGDVRLDGSRISGPANHEEGGVDGLLMPSQESDLPHKGACGRRRHH